MSGKGLSTKVRGEGGQSTVELALILPLVAVVLLAVVQVGLVVRDQVLVVHAAREAAREAAVEPAPDAARHAALAGSELEGARLDVAVSGRGAPGSGSGSRSGTGPRHACRSSGRWWLTSPSRPGPPCAWSGSDRRRGAVATGGVER